MPRGVPFLMYHELGVPGREPAEASAGYRRYVVDRERFQAQVAWLRSEGFRGVSVGQALKPDEAARRVAVTFDDGSETDLLVAAPLLREAGFEATFYVTVGFLGRRGFLVPAQLRELAALGFEIGSHGLSHRFLSALPEGELRAELVRSREELERVIGAPVRHLSCPGGRWSPRVAEAAQEAGYASVATSRIGVNGPAADRLALARVAITRNTSLEAFQRICRGEGLWRGRLKDGGLGLAKRLLGNRAYQRLRGALLGDAD